MMREEKICLLEIIIFKYKTFSRNLHYYNHEFYRHVFKEEKGKGVNLELDFLLKIFI